MNKLEGLLEIERLKLPHPKWEFVEDVSELRWIGEEDEYVGWTVRTCTKSIEEFYLPHANWLTKEEVKRKISEFKKKFPEAIFVVYPSWEFIKAACIGFYENQIIIEVVKGKIQRLLYKGLPDLTIIYERFSTRELFHRGNKNLLSEKEYRMLLSLKYKIEGNKILQWSHTTNEKYFFHDLRDYKPTLPLTNLF